MRKTVLLFLLIATHSIFGQTQYRDIIKPRFTFSTDKNVSSYYREMVILDNDTLFADFSNNIDLSHFDTLVNNKAFLNRYIITVLPNIGDQYYLYQWSVPLKVYMDKDFPNSIVEKFKAFYEQINGIKNLDISFVNKIEDANYYIKLTEKEVNAYDNNYKFDSEADRITSIYTGCTYQLVADKNCKYYAATLQLSTSRLQHENQALNQLKQLFFSSLGRFYPQRFTKSRNSLVNIHYIPQDSISELNLKLLRVHYHLIYEQPMSERDFDKLLQLRKQKQ